MPAAQKKTARPVSRSRRFARTFNERSSHSPRGAAGHNPLRDREWPVTCGIPARYHHPRGTSAPCAWSVRIEPSTGFPSHSPLERRCGAPSKTTSTRHSRGPSAALATARNLAVPLSARCPRSRAVPNFVRQTFCLEAHADKRENRALPVDWRDNEDGFPSATREGSAAPCDALNPAPR